MGSRMHEVMLRRQALLAKISTQREELAALALNWKTPLHIADQAWVAARFLRSHPLLVAGAAVLVAVRRKGVAGLVKGVWRIWQTYRYVNGVARKMTSRQ